VSFVHLHSHTHFSLGEGVSSPEAMLEAAAARGFTALACTDTNGVYGAVEFQQAAESMGIRPILGAHLKSGAGHGRPGVGGAVPGDNGNTLADRRTGGRAGR
jgi:error-prone DNA polymerase